MYFCSMCRDKAPEDIAAIKCSIEHTVKSYVKGEHIAFQNDRINHLYLLNRGRVKTEIVSDSGQALPVEEILAPYPLAAAFLFADDSRFPVDIIAIDDCELVLIKKSTIEKQMATCVGFMRGFMAFSANRMKFLSDRLKLFSHRSIKAKLAFYILSHEKKGEFQLNSTITNLAEYFGVERPSLSRALSEMERDGIIDYQTGYGKILNPQAMQNLLM